VTLTPRQEEHLRQAGARDAALGNRDAAVEAALAALYGVSAAEAGAIRAQVEAQLDSLPITIAASAAGWFGKGQPKRTTYRAGSGRRQEAKYSKLFDKRSAKGKVRHLGVLPGGMLGDQQRGEDYFRFRQWKDMLSTGQLGFEDEELPTYGSININWEARGTGQLADGGGMRTGVSSYGDTHFVLRRDNVRDRVVYTAGDYGIPRKRAYHAFCDFVLGGTGITPAKDMQHNTTVHHIVNSLLAGEAVFSDLQKFEVQIFGDLDIARDVEAIYVAPEVPDKVYRNVVRFCRKRGIACERAVPDKEIRRANWFAAPRATGGLVEKVQAQLAALAGGGP
jgi:hypothetical protein